MAELIGGHQLPKEVKHYYMKDPDNYDPDEFGWHPKLEIGYQTSVTDRTVYWDRDDDELDRHDLRRELEELLVNVLDWSGLDLTGGEQYQKDAYFKPDDRERRSLKLVDCPLPEIESQQEQTIMRLWGDMNPSDRAVVDTLLTDGGEISPQDAADETGFCYDTILRAVDRLVGRLDVDGLTLRVGVDGVRRRDLDGVSAVVGVPRRFLVFLDRFDVDAAHTSAFPVPTGVFVGLERPTKSPSRRQPKYAASRSAASSTRGVTSANRSHSLRASPKASPGIPATPISSISRSTFASVPGYPSKRAIT